MDRELQDLVSTLLAKTDQFGENPPFGWSFEANTFLGHYTIPNHGKVFIIVGVIKWMGYVSIIFKDPAMNFDISQLEISPNSIYLSGNKLPELGDLKKEALEILQILTSTLE